LVGSKSQVPLALKRRGSNKGMNIKMEESLGVTLGFVLRSNPVKHKETYRKRESWRLELKGLRKKVKIHNGEGRKLRAVTSKITNWYTCKNLWCPRLCI
jgi:hypothetical protein